MSIILGVERKIPARPNFRRLFFAPTQKKAAENYPIVRGEKFFVKRQFEAKEKWR